MRCLDLDNPLSQSSHIDSLVSFHHFRPWPLALEGQLHAPLTQTIDISRKIRNNQADQSCDGSLCMQVTGDMAVAHAISTEWVAHI